MKIILNRIKASAIVRGVLIYFDFYKMIDLPYFL